MPDSTSTSKNALVSEFDPATGTIFVTAEIRDIAVNAVMNPREFAEMLQHLTQGPITIPEVSESTPADG